ncbi:MAG: hypothetical protein ABW067_04615, partial [Rhizobacter sp.]
AAHDGGEDGHRAQFVEEGDGAFAHGWIVKSGEPIRQPPRIYRPGVASPKFRFTGDRPGNPKPRSAP